MTDDYNATLYLSTDQISTNRSTLDIANQVGSWSNGRTNISFNVKIKVLLGDLYDKYDNFLLNLTHMFIQNNATITGGRSLILLMGGLQWVNSSYDQVDKTNGYWISLPPILAGSGQFAVASAIYDNQSAYYLFRKSSAEETITFRYIDVRTNATPSDITQFPAFQLIFKIQPVPST